MSLSTLKLVSMLICTGGHALPTPENVYDVSDLTSTSPFFLFVGACSAGDFTYSSSGSWRGYCFCEDIHNIEFGAFAVVGCVYSGPGFPASFWDGVLIRRITELGMACAHAKEENLEPCPNTRAGQYGQHLFGDPAAKLKMNRIPYIMNNGDFGGDGASEVGIYRNNSGLWAIKDLTQIYYGDKTDLPVNGDYSGDTTADIAIFRKTTGLWAIRGLTHCYFGNSQDMPVPGDYNGDGLTDIAVYRFLEGKWLIKNLSSFYYGNHLDIPTVLDYNGDGTDDVGLYRPSAGCWYIRNQGSVYFGTEEDLPIPADYDADGSDEIAIFRPLNNLWAVKDVTRVYFGDVDTYYGMPVPADYDGNNLDDISIFRPTNGLWAIKGFTRHYFGSYVDFPVFGSSTK